MSLPFTFERQIKDSGLLSQQQVQEFDKITRSIFRSPSGQKWLSLVTQAISPMGPSLVADSNGKVDTHQTVAYDAVRTTIGYLCAAATVAAPNEETPNP